MWAHGDFKSFLKGQNYMISMDKLMNKKQKKKKNALPEHTVQEEKGFVDSPVNMALK